MIKTTLSMETGVRLLMRATTTVITLLVVSACGPSEPAVEEGATVTLRRLSEDQYRNSIADIFGKSVIVSGRFDPLERVDGLLAVGASKATITPTALERYDALARSIAEQVVSEAHRDTLIPCQPRQLSVPDDACASDFFESAGAMIFRRPLTEIERSRYVDAARAAAERLADFYGGLGFSLAGMLVSPQFLFIDARSEPDPEAQGQYRLDAYSKASRLSFFLWNTTPDPALIAAASSGELDSQDGVERQFERMVNVPHRVDVGIRAFFQDMLHFEGFDTLEKDPVIYPMFSARIAADAKEQTLRTLTDLLINENRDYREIFTNGRTYLSGALGYLYKLPVDDPTGWQVHEFSEDSPFTGIQSSLSMLGLFSHPGKSSPTLRGKAVRELLLCQKIPDPPGDVDFSDFTSAETGESSTARDRLAIHNEEPSCAGCHKLMDPIGLGLENFDAIGQHRLSENGAAIDSTGVLDGIPFTGPATLGRALYENPAAPECLTQRIYAYAAGRSPVRAEREYLEYLVARFQDSEYSVRELMRSIVLSQAFYRAAPASGDEYAIADVSQSSPRRGG